MQNILIAFHKDNYESVLLKDANGHIKDVWKVRIGQLTTTFMNEFPKELPPSLSLEETNTLHNDISQFLWIRNNKNLNQLTITGTFSTSELSKYLKNISIRLSAAPRVADNYINARFDNIKNNPKVLKKFVNSFELVMQYVVSSYQSLIALEILECVRRNIKIEQCKCDRWYIKYRNNKTCELCPPPTKTSRFKMPEKERNLERFKANLSAYVKRQAAKKGLDVKSFLSNSQNKRQVLSHLKKYIESKKYAISEGEIEYWLSKLN